MLLDYIVLGMILDESLTGYDIKKHIEAGVGNFYKVSFGNLYPALKRLTDKELVTLDEQTHGNRVKKYYIATAEGRKDFMEWLSTPFDYSLGGSALMTKIYFFGYLPEEARKQQLQEYEIYYRQNLRKLRAIEKAVHEVEGEKADYFMMSTLYYGIRSTQTAIEWFKHITEQKPLPDFVGQDDE